MIEVPMVARRDVSALSVAVDLLQRDCVDYARHARRYAKAHLGNHASTESYRQLYAQLAPAA